LALLIGADETAVFSGIFAMAFVMVNKVFKKEINFYFHPFNKHSIKSNNMKKLLLVLISFTALSTYGQFTKGTRIVGVNIGSVGFNANNTSFDQDGVGVSTSTTNFINFSLTPSMGWFINENIVIGANLGVNFQNRNYKAGSFADSKTNDLTFGLGGYGRYYFGASGFMPYGQVSLGGAFGSGKGTGNSKNSSYSDKWEENKKGIFNLSAGALLGLTKMVNKNIGLDLGLGYSFVNSSYNYSAITNRQFVTSNTERLETKGKYNNSTHGVAVSIGMLVFLDPKK
jgi:outer membrane protein